MKNEEIHKNMYMIWVKNLIENKYMVKRKDIGFYHVKEEKEMEQYK